VVCAGVLSKYSRDLTSLAKEGKLDPVVGRHGEMRRLIDVLGRRTKNRCENVIHGR
jgi:ATP-dependent Clp protease ATP-binding subunit ClpB